MKKKILLLIGNKNVGSKILKKLKSYSFLDSEILTSDKTFNKTGIKFLENKKQFILKEKLKTKIDGLKLSRILKKKGIDTRPIFPSISTYPMWKSKNKFFSKELGKYGLNLPSGHNLKKSQIDYIAKSIKKILK